MKWDCRAGNAALGADGRLRWFDFEYCGLRHGAEDVAWLIGDEAWPLPPEVMQEVVGDALDAGGVAERDAYLDYLSVYLTLHCVQRLKLIVKEVGRRGWLSKARIRRYDDAGLHPEFAAQLCRTAAHFGDRRPLTRPLARDFEQAAQMFETILREAA